MEGIPGWQRLLDEMLAGIERVPAAEPTPEPSPRPQPPAAPRLVQSIVEYFAGRGEATLRASLARLAPHRAMIERIFAEEGVPREWLWLGLVESGYNPRARSAKGAIGMWQFIPATAQRFGLREAELTDPVKSTRAAARYLRFLYTMFGDWKLALAAYNAGENRVARLIGQSGTRDFWTLAPKLPRETRAYVPAVLAAQMLGEGRTAPAAGPKEAGGLVYAPIRISD